MSKFKAGDKVRYCGRIVEIGGEMASLPVPYSLNIRRYVFKETNEEWDWAYEHSFKEIKEISDNKPRRGQEFFVKLKFSHIDIYGDRIFHYKNFVGEDGEAIFLPPYIKLYIKNAEGQIVPYMHTCD